MQRNPNQPPKQRVVFFFVGGGGRDGMSLSPINMELIDSGIEFSGRGHVWLPVLSFAIFVGYQM